MAIEYNLLSTSYKEAQSAFPGCVIFISNIVKHTLLTCLEGDGISYLWLISKLNFIHWAGQTSLPRHRHRPTAGSPRVEETISEDLSYLSSDITLKIHECNHWSHFVGSVALYADNKWPASEDLEWNGMNGTDHKLQDKGQFCVSYNLESGLASPPVTTCSCSCWTQRRFSSQPHCIHGPIKIGKTYT